MALHEGSEISEELQSAVIVEIVDWFIRTNWSGQVRVQNINTLD